MAKIQPAPKKIYFVMPANMTDGYIDLSAAASAVNRRFYRQGLNWAVANIKCQSYNTSEQQVQVLTLQDSWVVSNAWTKAFKAWQKMQYEYVLDEQPSVKPKFNDFKIFANQEMYDVWFANIDAGGDGFQSNAADVTGLLTPICMANTTPYIGGEWVYSKLTAPTTGGATVVDYVMTMHGSDVPGTSVGLVHNYALSRSVPQSPDPQTGIAANNIFTALFDEGTVQSEEVLADMLIDNNEVPYDLDNYPGGAINATGMEMVHYDGFTAANESGIIQQTNTGPFNAQCGLIHINRLGTLDASLIIEVTLMPGDHRGYLCQEMQDV